MHNMEAGTTDCFQYINEVFLDGLLTPVLKVGCQFLNEPSNEEGYKVKL